MAEEAERLEEEEADDEDVDSKAKLADTFEAAAKTLDSFIKRLASIIEDARNFDDDELPDEADAKWDEHKELAKQARARLDELLPLLSQVKRPAPLVPTDSELISGNIGISQEKAREMLDALPKWRDDFAAFMQEYRLIKRPPKLKRSEMRRQKDQIRRVEQALFTVDRQVDVHKSETKAWWAVNNELCDVGTITRVNGAKAARTYDIKLLGGEIAEDVLEKRIKLHVPPSELSPVPVVPVPVVPVIPGVLYILLTASTHTPHIHLTYTYTHTYWCRPSHTRQTGRCCACEVFGAVKVEDCRGQIGRAKCYHCAI